jgi:hypothetical protein
MVMGLSSITRLRAFSARVFIRLRHPLSARVIPELRRMAPLAPARLATPVLMIVAPV